MIASPLLHCPNLGPLESDGVKFQNSLLVEAKKIDLMGAACNIGIYYAVASHYYKKLFCENSDVRGFL